ncbi:MAG: hypothetical protein JJE25_09040 [Bacteroidia bacterium]|nr:hypothetical protein [Bacteroidia bacterium]
MKKQNANVKEAEFTRLKRWASLSPQALAGALDVKKLCSEENIRSYLRKHRKEIHESLKRIDMENVFKRAQRIHLQEQ